MGKLYIYENDKGGLYTVSDKIPDVYWDNLNREPDYLVGEASNRKEAITQIEEDAETLDYSKQYLKKFIRDNWEN